MGPGAKFCGQCGAPVDPAPTPIPGPLLAPAAAGEGERRQLTALFCDLVGSTEIASQLDPEEWHRISSEYQQAAAAAVTRVGGHVDKFLGDGLVCFFGMPRAYGDDAERAVRAGLAIVEAVRTLKPNPAGRLQVRVGMHTGWAVVACGGGRSKDVFGETPNLAARVQGAAAPGTVVITAATQRLVAGRFVVEDLGPQQLKGVREPVQLLRVVQPSGVRGGLELAAGRLTPFVGREAELATLVDRWERAQNGEGQNVVVVGEAGVGKSRLLCQLRERLAAVSHTWLEGGATPYTKGTPYHPIRALLAQGLGWAAEDTTAEKVEKLARSLGDAAPAETVALLADFLDLPPPTPLAMNPDLQRRKTLDLLAQWSLALSATRPLVVLVEDLHWCDASSLELLGRLVAQSATARVLLLATARPEFVPPWTARENLTVLRLARLTKHQAQGLVTALAGDRLPADILEALVARADGVPLYLEELTKAVGQPGAHHTTEAIPATLADSLMARLDRLAQAKEVAQRAAVLGREFAYPLLAAVAGLEEPALRQSLGRLIEAEILFVQGQPPQAAYTFKHALVQEAAYESLLKRTRQELHGRVLDVLLAQGPERPPAEPEVVARHAELAGRLDEAMAAYERAGAYARARSAHEEAIGHLRKAIALLAACPARPDRTGREVHLQLALAPSLAAARGYAHPETEAAYERARDLARADHRPEHLSALVGLGNVYLNSGRFGPALQFIDRALAIAEAAPDDWHTVAAYRAKVMIAYFQGHLRMALEYGARVATLYDPSHHHQPMVTLIGDDPEVVARSFVGWALWLLGYAEQADASARRAIEAGDAREHPFSAALARFFAAAIHWMCRNTTAQRQAAEELMQLAGAQGFPFWLGLATALRGHAVHDPAEVAAGMGIAAATGNRAAAPLLFAIPADACRARGQYAEARAAVEMGLAVAVQTGQPFFDAELHRLRGEITIAECVVRNAEGQGSTARSDIGRAHAQAEICFRSALGIARTQEARSLELRAAISLARLWQDQGKWTAARELLQPIYGWFTEGFDTGDLIDARALLDELSHDRPDPVRSGKL